jgi:hypothetical protein
MKTQERNDQPGQAHDCGQTDSAPADDPCGTSFDYIDEAIEESMDASDPPALAPQTTIGPPAHAHTGESPHLA